MSREAQKFGFQQEQYASDDVGGEVQLMADGCVALLQLVFGETNWMRWNEIKHQTQVTDFQMLLTWLLDLAEQEIHSSSAAQKAIEVPQFEVPTSSYETNQNAVIKSLPISHYTDDTDEIQILQEASGDNFVEIAHKLPPHDTFYCRMCNVALADVIVVREHYQLRHSNLRLLITCVCCSGSFSSIKQFVDFHATAATGGDGKRGSAVVCSQCAKTFSNKFLLDDHVHNKHLHLGPRYKCQACGKCFAHAQSLYRHRKQCTPATNMV